MRINQRNVLPVLLCFAAIVVGTLALIPNATPQAVAQSNCSIHYDPCVPPAPPDLNCGDISFAVQVYGADPHRFDGDNDGVGCEGNGTPPRRQERNPITTTSSPPSNQLPVGVLDLASSPRVGFISVAGWAHDPDVAGETLRISVTANDVLVTELQANGFRPDVGDTLPGDGRDNHGYTGQFAYHKGTWEVCTTAHDANEADATKLLGCDTVVNGTAASSTTTTSSTTTPSSTVSPPSTPPTTNTVVPPATCFGMTATMVGTDGDDVLIGTGNADVIIGGGGDDVIKGRGGDDIICAGGGDDSVWGNTGDDRIHGGTGNDLLRGQKGDDELRGGPDDDRLLGHRGNDALFGQSGTDTCTGNAGVDEAFKCERTRSL